MYTFFLPLLFIFIPNVTARTEYRRGRSSEPKIFSTCIDQLGCVDTNEKWYDTQYRPVNLEPLDRHTIRTEFLLMKAFTNGSKDIFYDILTLKPKTVEISGFKPKQKTFFLIHDFTSNGHTGWIKHIAIAITEELDANIITIDWEAGAEPPFDQAVANARVVALETEKFVEMITKNFGINSTEIHMIGHGVGAHIAGYVGKSVKDIGRITALDPTGPRFENMPSIVRLDPDDAKYVEVLHTEAFNHRSQGTLQPMGHSDFYLNNAAHQPGCNETNAMTKFTDITRSELREGKILPACSHKRAFKYYISAITTRECKFIGIACSSYESFLNGSCSDCDNSICATFDMCPPPKNVYKTRFFLNTHSEAPFCMYAYQVNISIENNENAKKADGYFEFILIDVNNKITFSVGSEFGNTKRTYVPGVTYTLIIYAPPPAITHMKEAKVRWRSGVMFPFPKKTIYVKYISVKRIPMMGESVVLNGMCPESGTTEIKDSAYIQFVTCNVARIQEEQRIAALTTLAVKVTTMASTTTTASTTIANVTWTLANSTTTTPKPPMQCLTPGPPDEAPKSNQTAAPVPGQTGLGMAHQAGAAGMLSNISMNGSLGPVQTICYTVNVPENATLKVEELTNLVFFEKHRNKTTIPVATATSSSLSTVATSPPEKGMQEEQQAEKPPKVTTIHVEVLTPTISEEVLEGFQTEASTTATTPPEEVENEAIITLTTASQIILSSTITAGTSATAGIGVETSTVGIALTSGTTHEVVETASVSKASTFPAEHVETISKGVEATTMGSISTIVEVIETTEAAIISTGSTIETTTINTNIPTVIGEIESTTVSTIPTTAEEIEATTLSTISTLIGEIEAATANTIPTLVGEIETTYEIIQVSAASNASIMETGATASETTLVHVETTPIPIVNVTEALTEETSAIIETKTEEVALTIFASDVIEAVTVIENVTEEQPQPTEVAEAPQTSKATESVNEISSETGAPSSGPQIVEVQFGGPQAEGTRQNETSKSFTLTEATAEASTSIEAITEPQTLVETTVETFNPTEVTTEVETSTVTTAETFKPTEAITEPQTSTETTAETFKPTVVTSEAQTFTETTTEVFAPTEGIAETQLNESSTCTEWNITELVTEVQKEEFTYVMRFTEEKGFISQNLQVTGTIQREQSLPTTETATEKPSLELTETAAPVSPVAEITPIREGEKEETTAETQTQQVSTAEEMHLHTKHMEKIGKGGKMTFLSGQIVSHNKTYEEIIKEGETEETTVEKVEQSSVATTEAGEETVTETSRGSASTKRTESITTQETTSETTTTSLQTTTESTTTTPKTTESTTTTPKTTESTTTTPKTTRSTTTMPHTTTEKTTMTSRTTKKATTHSTTKRHITSKHTKTTRKGTDATTECITEELPECDEIEE